MSLLNFTYRVAFQKGDSHEIIPLGVVGPGSYLAKIDTRGVSLLSTLYVQAKDVGATITVEYFDFTMGGDVGEENPIGSHIQPADGQSDKILISNLHNKPFARITVAGGNVTFSLYGTALTNASDGALVKELEAALLAANFGLGMAGLDSANSVWRILRASPQGYLITTTPSSAGVGKILEQNNSLNVGVPVSILSSTVPTGKTWAIGTVKVVTRGYGRWEVFLDAVRIASGLNGPACENSGFLFPESLLATAGQTIDVQFEYSHGPSAMVVDAFIGVLET